MNGLVMLAYKWVTNGWWLLIEAPEKGADKENIMEIVFFPEIETEKVRTMRNGEKITVTLNQGSFLNDVRNFGDFCISGFVKYFPKFEPTYTENSLKWGKKKFFNSTDSRINSQFSGPHPALFTRTGQVKVDTMVMGKKTVLTKQYPKKYIWINKQWIPELVYQDQQNCLKETKVEQQKEQFMSAMKQAGSLTEMSHVVKKFSVPFRVAAPVEKKYTTVEIAANGEIGQYGKVSNAKRGYIPEAIKEEKAEAEKPILTYRKLLEDLIAAHVPEEKRKEAEQAALMVINA